MNQNTSPPPPKQFLKAAEIAATYRIALSSVYRLADSGQLPRIKFAGTIRFDATAAKEFFEGGSK